MPPRSDRPVQAKLRCKHHRRYQGRFTPLASLALCYGRSSPARRRSSVSSSTICRPADSLPRVGADRIQVREWLPGGGGHRRTASATATARAENGTCQRTRIVDDTCPAPRDPMVPPALPVRSKSPPRSPSSACRLISKPIPYSPPCLRENWMLPRRDRLHIMQTLPPHRPSSPLLPGTRLGRCWPGSFGHCCPEAMMRTV